MATPFRTKEDFWNSLPTEEFGDCSPDAEFTVKTSNGIWPLAPSRLGLKIIVARGLNLSHVIREVARDLVWLRWFEIGQENLPSLIPLKNLRVLELYEDWKRANHHLRELWVTECDAPLQLRELIIFDCLEFQGFPKSLGRLEHLKKIVLNTRAGGVMKNVESLPEEFCLLKSLEHLELVGCSELSSLPDSIGNLRNMHHLALSECRKLRSLPDSFKELKLLQHLDVRGCVNLTFRSDIIENMSKLEHLNFSECGQLEELPCHIINQASLRELYFDGMDRLREVPIKICQLSKLQSLRIGSYSLTSLPASLGDLSSLTDLKIGLCRKLESLPESVNQLINLEMLNIWGCPVSDLNLGVGSMGKLKEICLDETGLSKISISEDCCPILESVTLNKCQHLMKIEVLPRTVRCLRIIQCFKLSALPSFAQLTSLREFELKSCYQVKEIQGLQHCRKLEVLKAYTWWEVPCIQSLECMERLRTLHLTAMRKSAVEGCIQSVQKWPGEIIVCTPLDQIAAPLLNLIASLRNPAFPKESAIDLEFDTSMSEFVLKQPTNGNVSIVILIIYCATTPSQLFTVASTPCWMEVGEGIWVWIGVFTRRSEWHTSKSCQIFLREMMPEVHVMASQVLTGLQVMAEENAVLQAFRTSWS